MLEEFEASEAKPKRARSWVAATVSLAIIGGGLAAGYFAFRDAFEGGVGALISRFSVEDYDGEPGPPVVIVIEPGETGEDVARKLVDADVIKSFERNTPKHGPCREQSFRERCPMTLWFLFN